MGILCVRNVRCRRSVAREFRLSKRIGIYSGAFDPIHDRNLAFVEHAREVFGLDKVFFLVEPRPRHKQGVKALSHRRRMVDLAIADHAHLGTILLDKPQNAIEDSLPELEARFKGAELYLLIHEDIMRHVAAWPKIHDPRQLARLAIGVRAEKQKALIERLDTLQRTRTVKLRYEIFTAENVPAVSQRVRLALRKGKLPTDLTPEVREYIIEQGLYSSTFDLK